MKPILFFIISLLLLSSCVPHSQDAIQDEDFSVNLEETLDYLNEMAEETDNPNVFYQRGNVYFQLEDYKKAYQDVQKAIELRSSESGYFVLKGKVEQQLEQPEKAIESLLIAEKLGARDEKLYDVLATEYLQLNEVTKAKAAVDRLIRLESDASSYALQGDVFLAIGDSSEAISSYKKAISQGSALKPVYKQLINIYSNRLAYKESGQLLNQYLEGNPSDYDMLLQKGRLLNQMGEYDSAKHIYKRILGQDSSKFMLFYELSDIFYVSSNFDSSAYYAQKALQLNNDFGEAQITLARSLDKLRKYQEAIEVYERILQIDSTHNLASQELDNLKRKVAYLWQLEQQKKKRQDSAQNNLPPTVEKKEIVN